MMGRQIARDRGRALLAIHQRGKDGRAGSIRPGARATSTGFAATGYSILMPAAAAAAR